MDTPTHSRDIFDLMGTVIGYVHIVLFSIVLTCYSHFTFNVRRYPYPSSFYGCLAMLSLVVAMFALSFLLAIGISVRQPNYLLPWLIMTVITVIADTIYLSINRDDIVIAFGSVILFALITTWYPISKLYQRYDIENETRDQQGEENCPLERPAIVSGAPPDYQEANGGDPPPYSVAMGVETDFTYAAGKPEPDWRIDLQSETGSKEYK